MPDRIIDRTVVVRGTDLLDQLIGRVKTTADSATDAAILAGHYANDITDTDVPGGTAGSRGSAFYAQRALVARDKAQDWAEGAGNPGGAGTKSSKAWAEGVAASAQQAILAANAAALAGNLYASTAEGLAAVAEGAYFSVAGSGDLYAQVYRKVSGAASLITSYPSVAAVKRIGFVPALVAGATQDNAPAINAALADASVTIVQLPPGDWYINQPVMVPSGKWLRGAGRGVTRLIGRSTILASINGVAVAGGTGIVTIRENPAASTICLGAKVTDLSTVSPKVATKVQGVWARNAQYFYVENVEALNCGYAFWAQEMSRYGVFRNIRSRNANVHFETTRAFDILFDGMEADDGDGDNPLGVEAVWHTLFESKRITFRNGRHRGKGQAFYVVSDSITAGGVVGDVGDGLIDDVRFENLKSVNTDGKIVYFASRINGSCNVGKVVGVDLEWSYADGVSGVPMQVQMGQHYLRGGSVRHRSQDGMMVYATASLEWINPRIYVDPNPAAFGGFFQGVNTPSPMIIIEGGYLETTSDKINNTFNNVNVLTLTPSTRIVRPGRLGKIYTPTIGKPVRRFFPADVEHGNAATIGSPTADEGQTQFLLLNGGVYRIRLRGRMKKAATGVRQAGVRIDGLGGTLVDGFLTIQTAADVTQVLRMNSSGRVVTYDAGIDEVMFDATMTVIGAGANMTLTVPNSAAPTIVAAGTEFFAERVA